MGSLNLLKQWASLKSVWDAVNSKQLAYVILWWQLICRKCKEYNCRRPIWDFMTFLSLETLQHCVLVNFPDLGRAILQKSNHPFVIFSKGFFSFCVALLITIHELHVKTLPHTYCITDACFKSGVVIYFILSWKFKSMNNCLFNLA